MLRVSEVYPSNFIAAGDLDGREVTLTIERVADKNTVRREDGSLIDKAVLYFKETKRTEKLPHGPGLVLGKTNAKRIRTEHGNVMDKWVGQQVILYRDTTEIPVALADQNGCPKLAVRGKMATVHCIRVKVRSELTEEVKVSHHKELSGGEVEW
jgi:hypothetical protein